MGTQLLTSWARECAAHSQAEWVGWLGTGRHHHGCSSDGGGSPLPLPSLAFPTKDGRGYLIVWFSALRSAGIVFVGVCGVDVLVMAFLTPEWAVVAPHLDRDCEAGVGLPMTSLPMLALGVVHRRAGSGVVSIWRQGYRHQ